jgi:predicted enzyme related to lactoylglutathione lyase
MEFKVTIEDLNEGYAEFVVTDMRLALFRRQEMAEMIGNANKPSNVESQDRVVLIFTVPNLDSACQELKHKGIKFTTEPLNNPNYGIKTAYFRDPDGTLIGLFQAMF